MTYEIFTHNISIEGTKITEPPSIIQKQLSEYEQGDRHQFDLTVDFLESFTGDVHRELCTIPYGETRTYGQLAERLDTAPIAVGQACARNPLPVIVPCHRVVGVDSLRGYMYPGLQETLLKLEQDHSK